MRHPLLINSRIIIGNPSFINIGGYTLQYMHICNICTIPCIYAARVDNTLKNISLL